MWLYWPLKGQGWTENESVGFVFLFFPKKIKKNLKENALDIHFSHWTTDQQLEKSELKPRLATPSNKNVIVPICCSTLDA